MTQSIYTKSKGLIYAGIAGSYIATAASLTETIAKRLEAQRKMFPQASRDPLVR